MFPLDPSDIALLADLVLAIILALYFAVGKPRVWFRDRLGWVILSYAVATVGLLFLIVWGIVFGQKVHEAVRLIVSASLGAALVAQTWSVYRERRAGRMVNERPKPTRRSFTMSTNPSSGLPVTTDENGEPTLKPQTKVTAGAATAGVLVVIVAVLAAVTPDMLTDLGSWGVLLFAGITALGQFLGAYVKRPTRTGN